MFLKTKLRNFRKKTKSKIYQAGDILPVLSADELLAAGRHHALVEQLRSLCGVPDEYFDSLYFGVLSNFAEYVQILPLEEKGPLSGLLNRSIARAVIAFKNFILAQGKTVDPLLNYAVFTAALLSDIDKVVINHKIVLVDEKGIFVDDWRPFEGAMLGRGHHYKIYPTAPIYQRLQDTIAPLLARQILPELGFLWIANDPKVFAEWLDALRGDDRQGGRIGRALAFIKLDDIFNLEDTLPQVDAEPFNSDETKYGEAFLEWLKKGLANGDIKTNTSDATVHIVEEGVFLERKLFKQFAEIFNVPVNMNVVFTQFGNLFGIAKKGGYDYSFDQYFSEYPQSQANNGKAFSSPLSKRHRSLRDGMVLVDPAVLFVNTKIPATTPMLKAMQSKEHHQRSLPNVSTKNIHQLINR